ncbi:Glucosaminyl phosphatidylinositol (GlcN-PI) nositol acylation protein [Pseudocyphellaria aurata]|nr:Glucosaminyl phosphatidylinositol (GlcN-PI) nositol acylation protein [Pseudocyphellaria aurata]
MTQSYKTLKEDFVSNLAGGKISEINYVTAVAPAALLLWSALQSRLGVFIHYGAAAFLVDFLLNVGAILLATTLYSSVPILLNVLLILPALLIFLVPPRTEQYNKISKSKGTRKRSDVSKEHGELDPLPIRPFITAYRGAMMIITCLAILAVDFKIFPRRFAKVETWGTSLMDMGVGSFVFSAGVVSARPILKDRVAGRTTHLGQRLYRSAKHSLPLFILGLVRIYSVKGLELAEHVTEYGVHWNFFFTLALLPPSMALIASPTTMAPLTTAMLSLTVGGSHQLILEFTSLKAFILTATRTDLIRKNREGLFSFAGYLAIFLAGQAAGLDILPRLPGKGSSKASAYTQRKRLLTHLTLASFFWSTAFVLTTSDKYGLNLRVSRRLANFPYVLWVAAFNCTQLTIFCAIETWAFPKVYKALDKSSENQETEKAISKILWAFNRNGLAVFLLANPLTGFVNLTVDTLTISRERAIGVLLVYSALLTVVAVALDRWNISIKL